MFVENIMTENVRCIPPTTTVRELRDLFSTVKYHHLLVALDSQLLGVISDRDVISILSPFIDTTDTTKRDQALLEKTAEDIMSTNLVTAERDTCIDTTAILLLENNISCLPVVSEDKHIEGIVTWKDMLKYYVYAT